MGKTITDPLYGSVALSQTEAAIVSTPAFQRLHNVRQLGLAYLVFPNAGYSRFAHSIGACRNAAKMLDAVEANSGRELEPVRKAAYRMAALLHDVGHYPFSHTTEDAIVEFYSSSLFKDSGLDRSGRHTSAIKHEPVGEHVIKFDPEISRILKESEDINTELLSAIFRKTKPDSLFGIISSELDCDRLDYLARTAHLSGVPFGVVDSDFIMQKATLGPLGELAFERKASKAIDHLLVGRYYDYMQMVFHKTVEALEWSLSECLRMILEKDKALLSETSVRLAIETGKWCQYDDTWLLSRIKEHLGSAANSSGGAIRADHCRAVLYRKPAKRVYQWEQLLQRNDNAVYKMKLRLAKDAVKVISAEHGIPESRFTVQRRAFPLIKVAASSLKDNDFAEELSRSVRIVDQGRQKHLVQDKSLLISAISEMENYAVTVYYLPAENEPRSVRDRITRDLADAMTV